MTGERVEVFRKMSKVALKSDDLILNELEVVGDKWIFANEYAENNVFQINIHTGRVIKKWDLSVL